MPALYPPSSSDLLLGRTVANTTNATSLEPIHVVCSWPLSGQYGGGSRILYYVLVAACVLARKTEWLRNACLAAALILPATAAIHAIVLAALHRDDAIDMDIYGALQLCSIGILTAPATVRLSKTYFNNPGRNVLFVWTVLVLAGLLALTVEFFRSHSKPCLDDGFGRPLYEASWFGYNTTCGLVCDTTNPDSPHTPMREGSADNIYVIQEPYILSFGAATLVAAASCVPGILSMVTIWHKIAKTNWNKQFRAPDVDEVIEGTNGATVKGMKGVNDVIRRLLGVVEIPVFGGAVLALIVVGERNFWSTPVNYQTEPLPNIGQWSNIVASLFAAIGSLYMLWAKYLERAEKEGSIEEHLAPGPCHCECHAHGSSRPNSLSDGLETAEVPRPLAPRMTEPDAGIHRHDTVPTHMLAPTRTDTSPDDDAQGLGIHTIDSNSSIGVNTGGVTGALVKIANAWNTTSPHLFDDIYSFRHGKATGFPEIPGELNRNSRLTQIKQQWGEPSADFEDGLAPRGRRSRANSFNGSISRSNSIGPRAHSPQPPPRTPTMPTTGHGTSMLGLPTTHSPESTCESVFPSRPSAELEKAKSQGTVVTLHEGLNSPAIVLSSDDDPSVTPAMRTTISSPVEPMTPLHHEEGPRSNGGTVTPTSDGAPQQETTPPQAPPPATAALPSIQRPPPPDRVEASRPNGGLGVPASDPAAQRDTAQQEGARDFDHQSSRVVQGPSPTGETKEK